MHTACDTHAGAGMRGPDAAAGTSRLAFTGSPRSCCCVPFPPEPACQWPAVALGVQLLQPGTDKQLVESKRESRRKRGSSTLTLVT